VAAEHVEDGDQEWISLHEASVMLSVGTSTVRRWADAGRISTRRTLGGHRRFSRAAVVQLVGEVSALHAPPVVVATPAPPNPHESWGLDERELVRQSWHARLAARPNMERMRGLGQRLLGLLIQYVNRHHDNQRFLEEARAVGASYGCEARAAGVSAHDTVEAFLFFKNSFAQLVHPLPGIAQPTDLAEAVELRVRIDHFMDAILLGTVAGYESTD
jgi:excisionase family DNA binding protein